MAILIAFLAAVIINFLSNIPVGAVNMAIVQTTLNQNRKAAIWVGLGSLTVEMFYCTLPLAGFSFMEENGFVFHLIYILSIPALFLLGMRAIIRRETDAKGNIESSKKTGNFGNYMYGFTLCASNPMVIIFWTQMIIISVKNDYLHYNFPELLAYLAGVPVGGMGLYVIFIAIAHRTRENIKYKTRVNINIMVGVLFILLALYVWYDYFSKLNYI